MMKIFKKIIANYNLHFLLLGVALVLLQVAAQNDLLGGSFLRAFGSLMIYSIIALGFYLLLGYAGLASLGTAGFVGLGAYLTGYLVLNSPIPIEGIFIIVILAAIVLGLLVGFISLRIEGMYLAIITLGLSEILVEVFKNFVEFTNGVNGLLVSSSKIPLLFGFIELNKEAVFYLTAVIFVLLLILVKNITSSPTGRAMLAMKNSESAAQTMGVSLLKYRLLAFVIATVFAMIAGFLYLLYYRFVLPTTWTIGLSLNILAVVVIGGTKSIWGLLLGAFLIFGVNDVILQYIPFFAQNPGIIIFINGAIMIAVVMFYPGGISQLLFEFKLKRQMKKMKQVKS